MIQIRYRYCSSSLKWYLLLIAISFMVNMVLCKKFKDEEKPKWAKKDVRDYTDVDLERLLDQWEEDEDPLPEDELPEHLRKPPNIKFDPNNIGDPDKLIQMSKKGKTLMMFVRVKEDFSKEQADIITQRWQTSLWNSHIQAERYMVDDKRAIFMFKDGAMAWEAKDFLIEQEELLECTLENRPYYGRFTSEEDKLSSEQKKESSSKDKKKEGKLKSNKDEL